MVDRELTSDLIREGATLVEALDQAGRSPDAALWFYFPEGGWKLLLAETKVGSDGPRKVYRSVQKTLQGLRNRIAHMSLEDVAVAKPDAPVIKLLRRAIATGPGINGIRFTHNAVSGTMIEDVYIYRLKAAA